MTRQLALRLPRIRGHLSLRNRAHFGKYRMGYWTRNR